MTPLRCGMPLQVPQVFVTVTDQATGRIVSLLGPYATASIARTACSHEVSRLLIWSRNELDWVAEWNGQEFLVPADVRTGT